MEVDDMVIENWVIATIIFAVIGVCATLYVFITLLTEIFS